MASPPKPRSARPKAAVTTKATAGTKKPVSTSALKEKKTLAEPKPAAMAEKKPYVKPEVKKIDTPEQAAPPMSSAPVDPIHENTDSASMHMRPPSERAQTAPAPTPMVDSYSTSEDIAKAFPPQKQPNPTLPDDHSFKQREVPMEFSAHQEESKIPWMAIGIVAVIVLLIYLASVYL